MADTLDLYARSGATWTNTATTRGDVNENTGMLSNENVIYTQVCRLLNAVKNDAAKRPDIVLIYAGTNDGWFARRRPGIFSAAGEVTSDMKPAECTSLESSVELSIKLLLRELPGARIVVVTPVEHTKAPLERQRRVADMIDSTARRLGAEVLRADRDVDIRRAIEIKRHTLTTDGCHTSAEGARKINDYITQHLLH